MKTPPTSLLSSLTLWLFLLWTFVPCGVMTAQPGSSGVAFLKLGTAARGVAMADAMGAAASGAAAAYYNPAGLLQAPGALSSTQVLFTHREWVQGSRIELLGGALALDDNNAIGIAISTVSITDIEIRERPGEAQGTFTARNFQGGVSYARRLLTFFRVGISVKFLYEKLLVDDASGLAFDTGVQWETPIENLTAGLVLANLGWMSTLRNEASTLPSLLRIGPAYRFSVDAGTLDATVAADVLHIFPEQRTYLFLGGELIVAGVLAARAGYQIGSEGRGFSAGLGVRYGAVGLDYAYAPLSQDLGSTHTVSLGVNL